MKKNRGSTIVKKLFWVILVMIFIIIGMFFIKVLLQNKLKSNVKIGVSEVVPEVAIFIKDPEEKGEFITDISKIDTNKIAVHDISIVIDNKIYKSKLTIKDKVAPEIRGVKNRTIYVGDNISYKEGIEVVDNIDSNLELKVDSSNVNLNSEGVYDVIYSVTDNDDNTSQVNMKLNVVDKPKTNIDLDELTRITDEVLDSILSIDMTQYEEAEAIYDWLKTNINYISYSDKDNWINGAYEGLVNGKGDCYVYFATAKQLLTRAGIENKDIKEVNGKHYWNLVNLGEGWLHFDATKFYDSKRIFMWTDEQVKEVLVGGEKLHNWQ